VVGLAYLFCHFCFLFFWFWIILVISFDLGIGMMAQEKLMVLTLGPGFGFENLLRTHFCNFGCYFKSTDITGVSKHLTKAQRQYIMSLESTRG
jgi:hypothetical protein